MGTLTSQDRKRLIDLLKEIPSLHFRRGREAMLVGAGLEKLLPMLDLEGEPFVVVTDIVRKLEMYGRVDYDHEALGRFINIVKEQTGLKQQDFLNYLLTNYGLMVPAADLPRPREWHGQTSSAEYLEAVLGENTLRSISFLEQGLKASRPVALVKVGSTRAGTGFLVAPDLLITNHHVLPMRDDVEKTAFLFNYQLDFQGRPLEVHQYGPKPGGIFHTCKELDYAVVELSGCPWDSWGHLPLGRSEVTPDERVNIIQHPAAQPKQIAIQNNFVQYVGDGVVQYLTTTMPGSSGSPVFNDEWTVVALHHAGGLVLEPRTNRRYFRNEGILIEEILRDLPEEIGSQFEILS